MKMAEEKTAIAGSTGYLGKYLVKQLIDSGHAGVALARSPEKLEGFESENLEIRKAEVTRPETLKGILQGVDTLISTVGITRQKDGLTYMDVDYQANMNLLNEAREAGVRKFIYVSVLNGQNMRELQICEAKERFVDALKSSGMEFTIIRPTGFFSDMKDFLEMAKRGRVYLFGSGKNQLNPVHGADLAKLCLDAIHLDDAEIEVGGPEVLSQNDIAKLALQAWEKPIKITHLPDGIRRFLLWVARTFLPNKSRGPIEFFMTAMAISMVAPKYGNHHLADFFKESVSKS